MLTSCKIFYYALSGLMFGYLVHTQGVGRYAPFALGFGI